MRRILLIEEQHAVRRLLKKIIESLGHELVFAASPEEALATLDVDRHIDVVIADLDLPGVFDAFAALRRRRPVIGMASAADPPDLGVPMLPSPPSDTELAAALRSLDGGRAA